MKIWEVTYPADAFADNPYEHCVEYSATKREAERLARGGDGDFRPIDVPTDKSGLIAWLNKERT